MIDVIVVFFLKLTDFMYFLVIQSPRDKIVSQRIIFTRSQGTLGKVNAKLLLLHGFDFITTGFVISRFFFAFFHSQADFITRMRGTNEVSATLFLLLFSSFFL